MSVLYKIIVLFILIKENLCSDDLISPCPEIFAYEKGTHEPNRWYGTITLLSDREYAGVWLRIKLDKPSLLLGNWFGQVRSYEDKKQYLISNPNFKVTLNTNQTIRFFIQYDPQQSIPRLESFNVNAMPTCHKGLKVEPTLRLGKSNIINPSASITEEVLPNRSLLNPNNLSCGTIASKPRPLITVGQISKEGEFPWHAALYYQRDKELLYICGGSLISHYHVITAAHCVTKRNSTTPTKPSSIIVYLGKHYLKKFTTPGIQDRCASKIFPHPKYDAQNYSNDISIIKLHNPVIFSDTVRPICLWEDSLTLNSVINKEGSLVGWGLNEIDRPVDVLMQIKLPVVSQETCLRSFPEFFSRYTSSTTLCAGYRNGTSACNGDSGSGLVFPKSTPNKTNYPVWQLRGLTSISVALENQRKCDTSHYVIFTDAAKYLDWIQETILL